MVWNEEGHSGFRKLLLDLPAGEGPEAAPSRIATAPERSSVEMGSNLYGFRFGFAKDKARFQRHLTKTTHFIGGKSKYRVDRWTQLFIKEIVRLHGVPVSIVSERDTRFTSQFWRSLQKALGTQLRFSTAFHPQTDAKTERLNQVLEDMLRACFLDFAGCWDEHLPLMEFAYNNSYQATIQMAPFEALYARR